MQEELMCYDDLKEEIVNYWGKRSESFLKQRRDELHSYMAERWLTEIYRYLPKNKKLRILDVGCGTGFFSILLAKQGCEVTGIDLTPEMISYSKVLAGEEGVECNFFVMEAEKTTFAANTFDVVISRNLTWTLEDVPAAYKEWLRILKPDGILLNFDGNYGADNFTDVSSLPENHAHHDVGYNMMKQCENIKEQLDISYNKRPAWDVEMLDELGVKTMKIDLTISSRVYTEKDEFYNPTKLFAICATK